MSEDFQAPKLSDMSVSAETLEAIKRQNSGIPQVAASGVSGASGVSARSAPPLEGDTPSAEDLLAAEIERAAVQKAQEAQEAARLAEERRKAEESAVAEAARAVGKQKQNASVTDYVKKLAQMDMEKRLYEIHRLRETEIENFDKYFMEQAYDELYKKRENEFLTALKRKNQTLEDFLDNKGWTKNDFHDMIANKVFEEDRKGMYVDYKATILANTEKLRIEAEDYSRQLQKQAEETKRKQEDVERLRKDYIEYVKNDLYKEVVEKNGVPEKAYYSAYDAVRQSINITSPQSKLHTRTLILAEVSNISAEAAKKFAEASNQPAQTPPLEKPTPPTPPDLPKFTQRYK